jgi:hypothetical protein
MSFPNEGWEALDEPFYIIIITQKVDKNCPSKGVTPKT